MNFDLDTKNYNKEDYFDIFNLDKNMQITSRTVNTKYKELITDEAYISKILNDGSEYAFYNARKTLSKVYRKVGLINKNI